MAKQPKGQFASCSFLYRMWLGCLLLSAPPTLVSRPLRNHVASLILWSPKMRMHPPTLERITQRFCVSMIGEAQNSPSPSAMHNAGALHT
jgi:hypothetical protein